MSDEQKRDPEEIEDTEETEEEVPRLELDPELEAALAEAEAAAEAKPRRGRSAPATGAGEGLVRALSELKAAQAAQAEAEERAKDAEERLLRSVADFENYRKRITREREEERKYALEPLLKELLPVLDNLERALEAAEGAEGKGIVEGVRMVHRQFLEVLARFDVEQITALHQPFDPNYHEAMQQLPTGDHPPGTVVAEYGKGYTLKGRLVRPSMVVVASEPAGDAD